MIPYPSHFYFSNKLGSLIYVVDRIHQDSRDPHRVSHLKVADFKTCKTLYLKIEDVMDAIDDGRLMQVG
jgi:hypothetical protein